VDTGYLREIPILFPKRRLHGTPSQQSSNSSPPEKKRKEKKRKEKQKIEKTER
jgi:hypothetical protein